MEKKKGTHGTCKKHAQSIQGSGFNLSSNNGLRGRGIYFWMFESKIGQENAIDLARYWVKTANEWKKYGNHGNHGATLLVEVSHCKEDILNIDSLEALETINAYIKKLIISSDFKKLNETEKREKISLVYDRMVDWFEEKAQKNYSIVVARVQPPKPEFYGTSADSMYFQQPICFIVKSLDNVDILINDALYYQTA